MLPFPELKWNLANDIQVSASVQIIIHSELPTHSLCRRAVIRMWSALIHNPALSVASCGPAVTQRAHSAKRGNVLVVHRIHPGFNGEWLGVRGVQCRIEWNLGPVREYKECGM